MTKIYPEHPLQHLVAKRLKSMRKLGKLDYLLLDDKKRRLRYVANAPP